MKQIGLRVGLILAIAIFIASGWYLLAPYFLGEPDQERPRFVFPAKDDIGMIMPSQTLAERVAARLVERPLGGDAGIKTAAAIFAALDAAQLAAAPVVTPTATAITPTVVAQGKFVDGDVFHRGSGTAAIWRAADGSYVLRLTEFRTSVGPDLRVLLSPAAAPASHARLGNYLEVSKLKGNLGDQEYALPADFDPTLYHSVVIYCVPFRVIFATATLE